MTDAAAVNQAGLSMDLREEAMVRSLFTLAGFPVIRIWELANPYWPRVPRYDEVRTPWWLVLTQFGLIQIGRRKRVISISWHATRIRAVVTTDDVTKDDGGVHAWSIEKALEYLIALRSSVLKVDPGAAVVGINKRDRMVELFKRMLEVAESATDHRDELHAFHLAGDHLLREIMAVPAEMEPCTC